MENEILDYVMETPGNTNPAILGQMLDEASGTKLPEPTAQDNGKVLGVSDGSYALVNGGGGGGGSGMVTIEVMEDNLTGVIFLQTTAKELYDTFKSGETIILHEPYGEAGAGYSLIMYAGYHEEDGYAFKAQGINDAPMFFTASSDDDNPTLITAN